MRYFINDINRPLGQRIAQRLLDSGHEVHAIVASDSSHQMLKHPALTTFAGASHDRTLLKVAMRGCDAIFVCPDPYFWTASSYSLASEDRGELQREYVESTRSAFEIMHELNINKGIYTSSIGVSDNVPTSNADQNNSNDIGVAQEVMQKGHDLVKQLQLQAGYNIVIVKLGILYGPEQENFAMTLIKRVVNKQRVYIPTETTLSWTYIEDAAIGHVQAMISGVPGHSYDLSASNEELETTVERICDIAGIESKSWTMNPDGLKALSGTIELVGSVLPIPQLYTASELSNYAGQDVSGDQSKSDDDLGFYNRPLHAGLESTIRHLIETEQVELGSD